MDRKKWILVGSLAGILAIVLALLFWPKSEESEGESSGQKEAPFIPIEFLNEDPEWAIARVDSMSLDEKLRHLIIQDVHSNRDSLGNFGGYYFSALLPEQLAKIHQQLKDSVQPFLGMSVQSIFNSLDDSSAVHVLASNGHQSHDELRTHLDHVIDYYGVNYLDFGWKKMTQDQFYSGLSRVLDKKFKSWQDSLHQRHCLLSYSLLSIRDTAFKDTLLNYMTKYVNRGFAMFKSNEYSDHANVLFKELNFKGLKVLEWDTSQSVKNLSIPDAIITRQPAELYSKLKRLHDEGIVSVEEINAKVARLLLARKWAKSDPTVYHSKQTARYFELQAQYLSRKLQRNAITLVANNRSLIPLAGIPDKIDLIRIGNPIKSIYGSLDRYTNIHAHAYKNNQGIPWKNFGKRTTVIAINVDSSHYLEDSLFKSQLLELQSRCQLIVINGSGTSALNSLGDINTLIHLPTNSDYEWNFAGQMVFGGIEANGELAMNTSPFKAYTGKKTAKTRLAYGAPIDVGMDKDTLYAVRYIAEEGIRNRAYPGCQVLATKDGFLIHNGAYGYSSYKRQNKVNDDHIYDLASVTKVAATTVVAMKLHDEEKYGLYDSLEVYLPDSLKKYLFRGKSTLRHITFSELMTHQSGLPAGISYIQYVDYIKDSIGRFDRFYCDWEDDSLFYVPIADGFFMERSYQDSIWVNLNQMWLRDTKKYLYSDANFVLLYKLMRSLLDKDERLVKMGRNEEERDYNAFERYLQEQIYRPLKMDRTVYLPRRYFSTDEIAPTEDDKYWRKQLVHGYVHDPTAALLGGISGNAGLFSTGKDMVKLFQMLLNRGYYGGTRFIKEETVDRFIRAQPGSHRGLGFNKPVGGGMYGIPEEVSAKTFGHTGFTGNSVWADPENNIIYIFLSNRSHPDAHNPKIINLGTRKRIHKSIYHARITKDWLKQPESELSDSLQVDQPLP